MCVCEKTIFLILSVQCSMSKHECVYIALHSLELGRCVFALYKIACNILFSFPNKPRSVYNAVSVVFRYIDQRPTVADMAEKQWRRERRQHG